MDYTYDEAIAAVSNPTSPMNKQIGWIATWPSDQAIANDSGTVDLWTTTNQGPYEATSEDKAATNWQLAPDQGDRPPR
jgi:hypothetical protein